MTCDRTLFDLRLGFFFKSLGDTISNALMRIWWWLVAWVSFDVFVVLRYAGKARSGGFEKESFA